MSDAPPILTAEPSQPIAIVGMACRFPGGSDTPAAYWSLLRSGGCAITETPPHRWDVEEFYDPDPRAPGKMYSRHGAFLEQRPEAFDAAFFGISPHEAWPIDPSHRLLLEVAWESLEHAGIPPRSLNGSATGVFAGVSDTDYLFDQIRVGTNRDLSAYHVMSASAFATGRISYILGLEGPTVSIDTACSSSLVATLMAIDSLRSGQCRMALAGGTHLMISPMASAVLCRMTALSLTGQSRVFDASADGFVRGEGAGMLVLKRLDDAIADGDRVHALLRGGAWNHDGRSTSFAVPRGEAQERAILTALERTGLTPGDISYVEAHGTGTPVGDPIEAAAIGSALATDRPGGEPLLMASGKTNIGHLEAASGVAAIMKVVLALQNEEIPAHVNLSEPSPAIDWDQFQMHVPTEATPWPSNERPRRAGINSFGLSGTNSHLILEEAPASPAAPTPPSGTTYLLPVSARTEGSVRELADRYESALEDGTLSLRDFCHTAGVGRSHDRRRIAVVGTSHEEIVEELRERTKREIRVAPIDAGPQDLAFLFTGQGAQTPGMGRGLFESSDVFRGVMEECDEVLRPHLDRPLLSVLYGEADAHLVHRTEYTQPAMLALELALAETWAAWGIRPTHVMGHSLGEYAAATVAGVLDRADALRLVAVRGALMSQLKETGSMSVVFAEEEVIRGLIEGMPDVSVAAINGPRNTVISGRTERIEEIHAALDVRELRYQALEVSHAFHSPLMEPMLDHFQEEVERVQLSPPCIPLVSNVLGTLGAPELFTDPAYWRRHVREPVRFSDSVSALEDADVGTFVEIGPNPTLLGMAGLGLRSASVALVPSLRGGSDDARRLREAAATLYESGFPIDWAGMDDGGQARRIAIPSYPFERKDHWYETGPQGSMGNSGPLPTRAADHVDHPLLGTRLRAPGLSGVTFQSLLEPSEPRYLGSYRVRRAHFVPLGALVEMVGVGAREGLRWDDFTLEDVQIGDPFGIPRKDGRLCQVSFAVPEGGKSGFSIVSMSRTGSGTPRWITHLSGTVRNGSADRTDPDSFDEVRDRCRTEADVDGFYGGFKRAGFRLGDFFRPIETLWTGDGEVLARVSLTSALAHESQHYGVHPALLESVFQISAALDATGDDIAPDPLTTVSISGMHVPALAATMMWVHARRVRATDGTLETEVRCFDNDGRRVAAINGLLERRVPVATVGRRVVSEDEWSLGVYWHEGREGWADFGDLSGEWLVVELGDEYGKSLSNALASGGGTVHRCVLVDDESGDQAVPSGEGVSIARRSDPTWASSLLNRLESDGATQLRGVISCVGLYDGAETDQAHERLERAVQIAGDTTELVNALGQRAILTGPFLMLTRGSVDAPPQAGPRCLESATLWGLLPIVRAEYTGLFARVLDLDPTSGEAWVKDVLSEFEENDDEGRVARRSGRRLLARLEHFREAGPTRETVVRGDRAYLVTGGLGWIGRCVAEWLSERGAGLIALNARRAPNSETATWIRALRAAGTRVEVVLGDVADEDHVERIFGQLDEFGVELGGIFHAAGVINNEPLGETARDGHRQLLGPKVAGAWNLHRESLTRPVELFVLFGSIAALMGRTSQGAYASANACLPALAAHRTDLNLPVTCAEWGLWGGGGMVGVMGTRELEAFKAGGVTHLEPGRAMAVLEDHLREQTRRVVIASIDWVVASEMGAGLPVEPFLSELIDEVEQEKPTDTISAQALLRELDALTLEERTERLMGAVTGHMADVLGVESSELPPDLDVRLSGFDSLMALELRHRLETELGLTMPGLGPMGELSPSRLAIALAEMVPVAVSQMPVEDEASESDWVAGEI